MQLNTISPRTKNIKNAPVGRGGRRGKTSGRGGKGQTARAGHKIRPEMRDIIKKIPKLRGQGKNRSRTIRTNQSKVTPITIAMIEMSYAADEKVSPESLLAKGLVRRVKGRAPAIKILGPGSLTKALVVQNCAMSKTANAALVAAHGTIYA
jgi:large subunit ribosomal protein L15